MEENEVEMTENTELEEEEDDKKDDESEIVIKRLWEIGDEMYKS